ncbi:hypothetical protein [Caloramator quimbayensis]|uniref:hypothetical protein n=1 Tax=Caloramator quimbayensis TaxID=1147123 RepID=UPI0011789594|nr:hypothetical protein [Caloramator quimbayensis]
MKGGFKFKGKNNKKNADFISAMAHSEESRKSRHGYLEVGNDAMIHAKARALRNKNNTTVNVDEEK